MSIERKCAFVSKCLLFGNSAVKLAGAEHRSNAHAYRMARKHHTNSAQDIFNSVTAYSHSLRIEDNEIESVPFSNNNAANKSNKRSSNVPFATDSLFVAVGHTYTGICKHTERDRERHVFADLLHVLCKCLAFGTLLAERVYLVRNQTPPGVVQSCSDLLVSIVAINHKWTFSGNIYKLLFCFVLMEVNQGI